MKRYRELANSFCLQCKKWLCVMSHRATYTGCIQCKCGANNKFEDSTFPVRII